MAGNSCKTVEITGTVCVVVLRFTRYCVCWCWKLTWAALSVADRCECLKTAYDVD